MTNLEYLFKHDKELLKNIVDRDTGDECNYCAYCKPDEKCVCLECNLGVLKWLLSDRKEPEPELDWEGAIKYLDSLIVEYALIGWAGRFGLDGVLVPLKKRFDSGERTKKLYDEIMECE